MAKLQIIVIICLIIYGTDFSIGFLLETGFASGPIIETPFYQEISGPPPFHQQIKHESPEFYPNHQPTFSSEYRKPYIQHPVPVEPEPKYQKVTSYEYTPSPYKKPLSYIKLIASINDHHQTATPTTPPSIYSTSLHSSKVHHQVPTVVISSGSIPLNVDMKTKSTQVKVSETHENRPPESYRSYSHDGPVVLDHQTFKPVIHKVREVILPQRYIHREIRPVREEIHTEVAVSAGNRFRPQYSESKRTRENAGPNYESKYIGAEYSKPENSRLEYSRPENYRPECSRHENSRPEYSRPEYSKTEYTQAKPYEPRYKPEMSKQEYYDPPQTRPEYVPDSQTIFGYDTTPYPFYPTTVLPKARHLWPRKRDQPNEGTYMYFYQ